MSCFGMFTGDRTGELELTKGSEEKVDSKDNSRIELLAVVGTGIWTVVAGTILWQAGFPEKASEWGDFFAGAFAPVAFIWLVVAVFIQSHELKEQRKELALTRQEFELNRKVLQEQAEESQRQATFIGQQTEFLNAQQKVSDFKTAIETLAMRISHYNQALFFDLPDGRSHRQVIKWQSGAYQGDDLVLRIQRSLEEFKYGKPVGIWKAEQWKARDLASFELIVQAVDNCARVAGELHQNDRTRAEAIEIYDLQANLHSLYEQVKSTA